MKKLVLAVMLVGFCVGVSNAMMITVECNDVEGICKKKLKDLSKLKQGSIDYNNTLDDYKHNCKNHFNCDDLERAITEGWNMIYSKEYQEQKRAEEKEWYRTHSEEYKKKQKEI